MKSHEFRKFIGAGTLGLAATLTSLPAQADWRDWLDQLGGVLQDNPEAAAALDRSEVVAGLREALSLGTRNAIKQLGRPDGFLSDPAVRVPLPPAIQSAESRLRKLGLGGLVEEFSLSLNRAAEQAVPEVADIFAGAIEAMTINDAMEILNGPDDAATRYFERSSAQALTARIQPLVAQATESVGVTQVYKSLSAQAGPLLSLLTGPQGDLDSYVTEQAMDGLFTVIAEEEQKIRENPGARSTELLRRVFGQRDGG